MKNIFENKKVLITGHTGFKGSWLIIWLLHLGAEVVGYALDPKTPKDNFVLSGLSKHITDIRGDIRDFKKLLSVFKVQKPDIVLHLAAQALVLEGYNHPRETYDTNVLGTVNLLEACRLTDSVRIVVVVTSDKCYENHEWVWGYRENDPVGGSDPYSSSKGAVELVCAAYRRSYFDPEQYVNHKKALATVRAGNVIGGGDWSANRIVPDCIRALESSKKIEIRNPLATRPWQHVLEPLGGYLLLVGKMIEDPVKFVGAWNFGPSYGTIIPVKKLVENLIRVYGSGKWFCRRKETAAYEAKSLTLDISKAKHYLGWEPVLNLEETIQYTVDWYMNYRYKDVYKMCVEQIEAYINKSNVRCGMASV